MNTIMKWVIIFACTVLTGWLLWLWYGNKPTLSTEYKAAPAAKQVIAMERVDHAPPPKIRVLPKAAASKKLGLPQEIAQDDKKQIISTANIAPAPDGATTVTIMDTSTGEATTIVKANPRPLFSFLRSGAAGVRYGIDTAGEQQVAIFARQDVFRVGEIHVSGTVEARHHGKTGKSEGVAALEASYRW